MNSSGSLDQLHAHLAQWGLRSFSSDADYFAWQRAVLSAADLNQLTAQVERKRSGIRQDEIAFYDLTATPRILPVLYSQRYEYFIEIGRRVLSRIGAATTVLDFGCGVGILTTFYARHCPEAQFVGIDRSPGSIAVAQSKADELGVRNVRFECRDVEVEALSGSFDRIIATHALVQAEQDPGLPSRNWTTFERARDERQQAVFEQRTGIDVRLGRLDEVLSSGGRMIIFEKTRQLARLVPFQRAFARQGFAIDRESRADPVSPGRGGCRRRTVLRGAKGECTSSRMERSAGSRTKALPLDRSLLRSAPHDPQDPDIPLYENHWPSAQQAWESLVDRQVQQEETRRESDGRQLHVELGSARRAGLSLLCEHL